MRVAAGCLLTAVAVLLNFIELSSQATLADLFPGFDGMHLPAPITSQDPAFPEYADQIRRFNKTNNPITIDPCTLIVKRGNIIIGVVTVGETIQPITSPAGEFNSVYVPGCGFVQLEGYEIFRLGVHQRLSYVDHFERTASPEVRGLRIDKHGYAKRLAEIETSEDARVQEAYQRYCQVRQAGHEINAENLEELLEAYQEIYREVYTNAYRRSNARKIRFRRLQKKYGGL